MRLRGAVKPQIIGIDWAPESDESVYVVYGDGFLCDICSSRQWRIFHRPEDCPFRQPIPSQPPEES